MSDLNLSQRVLIDDANDIISIDGVLFSGAMLGFFTKPTPAGFWFRFTAVENGKLIVERKESQTP